VRTSFWPFDRRLGQLGLLYLDRLPLSNRGNSPFPHPRLDPDLMGSGMSEHRIRASQWWFGALARPSRTVVRSVRFTGGRSHYFTWFVSSASNRGHSPFPHPRRGSDFDGLIVSAHRIRACQWWFGALARPSQTVVCSVRFTGGA
jgi:hypothetical protein